MGQITWSTDVNAPCCPGEIVNDDGRTYLPQPDFEYPSVARTFGWDMMDVQQYSEEDARLAIAEPCYHERTDGTVKCPDCGTTASEFIAAAYDWLKQNHGVTADDPGYFQEER